MYSNFTNKELYKKCREIGALTLKYRRQFLGMIPEIKKRKLYLKYGMRTVREFSAKLAGVSHESVNEVLRIHRLLDKAPLLQEKLVSGEISYTKLRPIALIATKENQEFWLEKVRTMSRPTLEVYVREIRRQKERQPEPEQGIEQPVKTQTEQLKESQIEHSTEQQTGILPVRCSLPWKENTDFPFVVNSTCLPAGRQFEPSNKFETFSLKINSITAAKMRVFKQQLEKKLKKPLNWDETLLEILKLAKGTTKKTKAQMGVIVQEKAEEKTQIPAQNKFKPAGETEVIQNNPCNPRSAEKRYIPAAIRHQILEKNHGICDAPACKKPGEIFHHTERYALKPQHNPEKIKYLCKAHEQIAHHSLIKNEENSPKNWQFLEEPDRTHPKYFIDSFVRKFRMAIT